MAMTLRSTKGSALTHVEMDANFSGLADGSAWSAAVSFAGATFTYTAVGGRIRGDFINATRASRTLFQNRTTNTNTSIGGIANGTGTGAIFEAYGGTSDPDNAHVMILGAGGTQTYIQSAANGTGTQRAMEFLIGDTTRAKIGTDGVFNVASSVATPAAGSVTARLIFGTTAGFGIYYGSNAPTVSAAQGSLYLRSDGSSTSTRAYINTDGATTWTAITTAG